MIEENPWDLNFKLLVQYLDEFKKFSKSREEFNGINLGAWCIRQRQLYKNGELEQDKIIKLEGIGFIFSLRAQDWDSRYEILLDFLDNFKRFPKQEEIYQDFGLGAWCSTQRQRYKNGELDKAQIDNLTAIGFRFESILEPDDWNSRFNILITFIDTFSRFPKKSDKFMGFAIGSWFVNQRYFYKKGDLNQAQIKKLELLGGEFLDSYHPIWEIRFNLLIQYLEEFKKFPSREEEIYGMDLGGWCSRQRLEYKKGILEQSRIEKLKSIGFKWES